LVAAPQPACAADRFGALANELDHGPPLIGYDIGDLDLAIRKGGSPDLQEVPEASRAMEDFPGKDVGELQGLGRQAGCPVEIPLVPGVVDGSDELCMFLCRHSSSPFS
jgi:hypothetical protein